MIADVWTVLWKEYRELLGQRSSFCGGRLGLFFLLGVFGVFLPWQFGRGWVESPSVLVFWAWVPLMLVTTVVADTFAGERERHTLETLLASRLSDRAILFGKVGGAVAYGWGLTLIALFLGVLTVNLAYGRGELLLYPPLIALAGVVLALLAAGLAAAAGVLVSLRAATVRQAQQSLSIPIMLLLFVFVFGLRALPDDWRAVLVVTLLGLGPTAVMFLAAAVLAVLDAVLLAVAMARFQRARLILD